MEAKSRRFQYWKRIQAGILFFVFLFGALFMGSAQHAFATERVGREEVTRVDGRGRDVAIREGGEDIVIVPSDPNTSVPEGYVRVSFNKGSYGNFGEGKQFIFFILKGKTIADAKAANPALVIPTVKANTKYIHKGWRPEGFKVYKTDLSDYTMAINGNIQFQAQYEEKPVVVEDDPKDTDYVKVAFKALEGGSFGQDSSNNSIKTKEFYVIKGTRRGLLYINVKNKAVPIPDQGYAFNVWDPVIVDEMNRIQGGEVFEAKFKKIVIGPVNPEEINPDDMKYWTVNYVKGEHGTVAQANTFYVLKKGKNTLTSLIAPAIIPEDGWKFTGWDKIDTTEINQNLTITAQYKQKVVTEDPKDKDYVKVDFSAEEDAIFETGSITFWIFKNEIIRLTTPIVKGKTGWTFIGWDPAVKTSYSEDTTHKARYVQKPVIIEEHSNDADYIRVTFHANGGRIGTVGTKDVWVLKGIAKFSDVKKKVTDPIKTGSTFKEWKDALTNGTKVPEDKVFNTDGETFYAVYMKSIGSGSVISPPLILNTPKFFTLKDEAIIRLEDEKQGKIYIAEGTKEALNGAVKLDIAVDKQGKIHINFLDKDGNFVKTKGAVKLIMPIKEGLEAPYRVKVNGVYTTYGEENGCYSIVLRPTADVEMIRFTDTVDKQEGILEGTKEALNGAVSIKLEKKQSGAFVFHLYNAAGKEISSNGYVFVEVPIPEGKKAPYRLRVSGVPTTFEETAHGTISFAIYIK